MHTAINGRLDAISSISTAMRRLSAGPAETTNPHRIIDLIPKSWDDSHDKSKFRNLMAELHLWLQAWTDQGERSLVRIESVDKVERSTLHGSRLQNVRKRSVPDLAQNVNKRNTEDGSISAGS